MFFRKRRGPAFLDRPVGFAGLSNRDLMANVLLTGVTGGGKTTILKVLLARLFSDGWGGFVPAMKPGDVDWIVKLVKKCGRQKDLLVIDRSAAVTANFFRAITVPGLDPPTQSYIDSEGFSGIADAVNRLDMKGGDGDGGFWVQSAKELAINAFLPMRQLGRVPGVRQLLGVVNSAPHGPEELSPERFGAYQQGACCQLLMAADRATQGGPWAADYATAEDYWHRSFPRTDPRTRSGYVSRILAAGGVLSRGLPASIIAAERPRLDIARAIEGKIVVTDFPPGIYRAPGVAINCALKYMFQAAALARKVGEDTPGFVLCLDEYPVIGGSGDEKFMALSRSTRCPFVLAAQGFESIRSIIPNEDEADVLMGNANVRLFASPTPRTATELCESLGQRRVMLASGNVSTGGYDNPLDLMLPPKGQASGGFSESYAPFLSPGEISLRTGAAGVVDVIVTVAGRHWGGLPYTVASVRRE